MENLICKIDSSYKYLKISVYLVQKCNFNDEFLIEGKSIELDSLKDREISFFDPYLGKNNTTEKSIALLSADAANLTLLIQKGEVTKEESGELIIYVTDDYNDTYIISAHVSLSNYKI